MRQQYLHNFIYGIAFACVLSLTAVSLSACGEGKQIAAASMQVATKASGDPIDTTRKGTRSNEPQVRIPSAPGTSTLGNSEVSIDISGREDGYIAIRYTGSSPKVKVQIKAPNDVTYTYDLKEIGVFEYFPLSCGDGTYSVGIFTNVADKMYATAFAADIDVTLTSDVLPFLYPNQQVWYTEDTEAIRVGAEQVAPANDDLEAISLLYSYIISNFTYDWDKADNVQSGYIPDVDETLRTKTGICLDYAAVLTTMLRSQNIPTRMEIGYAGTTYHAWVSTYLNEIGWINGIIQFDGVDWHLMDPTLATTETTDHYKDFISSADNYRVIYQY